MDIKESGICEGIRVIYTTNRELLRERQKPLLKKIREAEVFKKFNPLHTEEADEIMLAARKQLEGLK